MWLLLYWNKEINQNHVCVLRLIQNRTLRLLLKFRFLVGISVAKVSGLRSPLPKVSSGSRPTSLSLRILIITAPILNHGLLFDHVNNFVWNSEIFNSTTSDIAFWHPPKLITILKGFNDQTVKKMSHLTSNFCYVNCKADRTHAAFKNRLKYTSTYSWCANNFTKVYIHPIVAVD